MAVGPELTGPFSRDSMRRALDRLANESFDLLIIGGGVINAAIASGLDGDSEGSLVVENIEISERALARWSSATSWAIIPPIDAPAI